MFRRNKGSTDDTSAAGTPARDFDAPPLKPFSKKGTHNPVRPAAQPLLRPEVPRQIAEIASAARRGDRPRSALGEANKLTVGRDIRLKGEISACDKLVVEGRVEASLTDARVIEVAPTGYFKGNAQVDEADISGRYEGELVVREKLTIRASGRVSGSVRYGRIVIEAGGEISGDTQTLSPVAEAPARNQGARSGETADAPETLLPDET